MPPVKTNTVKCVGGGGGGEISFNNFHLRVASFEKEGEYFPERLISLIFVFLSPCCNTSIVAIYKHAL